MTTYLSLFSGAAGGDLGLQHLAGLTCKGYVEYEPYCQKVLRQRIADGVLDSAPIFGDVRRFVSDGYAAEYRGMVDGISGGFPCQPFSVAGKRAGENDPRNMWPATIDCIRIIRPDFAFLENVPGLLNSGYFGRIIGDLAEAGYDCRWCVLSAADCGAPHRRERLWIMAVNADESHVDTLQEVQGDLQASHPGRVCEVADASSTNGETRDGDAIRNRQSQGSTAPTRCGRCVWWDADPAEVEDAEYADGRGNPDDNETGGWTPSLPTGPSTPLGTAQPRLGRVANGVAHRVDRLKAIGNGQVSCVAATAWHILREGMKGGRDEG